MRRAFPVLFASFVSLASLVLSACSSANFDEAAEEGDESGLDGGNPNPGRSEPDGGGTDSQRPGADGGDVAVPGDASSDGNDGASATDATDATDTAPPIDAPFSCKGQPNGTACESSDGKRRVCIGEGCLVSACGDKFVDSAHGEECDDGNDVGGDGCEPTTCKLSCHAAADCDDGNPCVLGRSCDASHVCTKGSSAPSSVTCTPKTGGAGYCNAGTCASKSCGNHVVDPGEDCDDGNADPADGCRNDCTFTCKSDHECDDHDACTGVETCATSSHTCAKGSALSCNDGVACTSDKCVPATGCVFTFVDADGDGYAPATGCGVSYKGGDCNDADPNVHPGAAEICNGKDDNCSGGVDEGIAAATCGVGACARTGSSCLAASCTAGAPVSETCNGVDDDCNGAIDNGVPMSSCGVGACARSGSTCFASSCSPGAPVSETCNGLDDDCNGAIDNGIPMSTCGVGQCARMGSTCFASSCTPGAPVAETCNGLDDNCNGAADDGLAMSTCGVGACANVGTTCSPSSCTPKPKGVETCNGIDDDCDGVVDNNVPARQCFDGTGGCAANGDGTFTCQGICKAGTQTCQVGKTGVWTACIGEVVPDSSFHASAYTPSGSWDWNCSGGDPERQYGDGGGYCTKDKTGACVAVQGWTSGTAPICGASAPFLWSCDTDSLNPKLCTTKDGISNLQQGCR